MQALLDYLQHYFLDEAQILARSGLRHQRWQALQAQRCLPQPSYRTQAQLQVLSFFGEYRLPEARRWYPAGLLHWLGVIDALGDSETVLCAHFNQRYRSELTRLAALGLDDEAHGDEAALQALLADSWAHFLAGSYGVCTRHARVDEIAAKGVAIHVIDRLTDSQTRPQLATNQLPLLRRAVDVLDSVSAPFAPHERAASSRQRCIQQVRQRYLGGESA